LCKTFGGALWLKKNRPAFHFWRNSISSIDIHIGPKPRKNMIYGSKPWLAPMAFISRAFSAFFLEYSSSAVGKNI